jgi:hypothetical protein
MNSKLFATGLLATALTVGFSTGAHAISPDALIRSTVCYEANGVDWKYDPTTKLDCWGYDKDGNRVDGGAKYVKPTIPVVTPAPKYDPICYDAIGAWKYDAKGLDCNGYLPDGNRLDGGLKYDPSKFVLPGMPKPEMPGKKPMRGNRCMESSIKGGPLKFKLKACIKSPKGEDGWAKLPKKGEDMNPQLPDQLQPEGGVKY